jgi:hypothetical protein
LGSTKELTLKLDSCSYEEVEKDKVSIRAFDKIALYAPEVEERILNIEVGGF